MPSRPFSAEAPPSIRHDNAPAPPALDLRSQKTVTLPRHKRTGLGAKQVSPVVPYRTVVRRGGDFGAHATTTAVRGFTENVREEIYGKFFESNPISHHPRMAAETMFEITDVEKNHADVHWFLPVKQMFTTFNLMIGFHSEVLAANSDSDMATVRHSLSASGSTVAAVLDIGPVDWDDNEVGLRDGKYY